MLKDIIAVSVVAYVFVSLTSPGMILHFWYKLIDRLPDVLYKPLGGCTICLAGQCSAWFYLIKYFHSYNIFEHILFICATILTVMILDKMIDYGSEAN